MLAYHVQLRAVTGQELNGRVPSPERGGVERRLASRVARIDVGARLELAPDGEWTGYPQAISRRETSSL